MSDASLPEIRLSDAERDRVIDQLNLAMADGRLDVAEFEKRTRQVYAATFPRDLADVLEGLPVTPVAAQTPARAPAGTRWFFSLIGDRTQRGDLDMGDASNSVSLLGDTTFDLRHVTAATVNLRVFSLVGDVTIVVRPGTRVHSSVLLLLGDRDDQAPGPVDPDGTQLDLRVVALMGDVTIRVEDA